MPTLAVWSPFDLVLSIAVPLGLAASRDTAIVVDLDPSGPPATTGADLATLVAEGPTDLQLRPTRKGTAILANGGIDAVDAIEVLTALAERWPHVVLRCAPCAPPPAGAIRVIPLLPEPFGIIGDGRAVYQRTAFGGEAPSGAPVLPPPAPRVVRALVAGRSPGRDDRWLRAVRRLWSIA